MATDRGTPENYTDIRLMILEELTCLYLRLNGYFLIPNYLLHLTEEEGEFAQILSLFSVQWPPPLTRNHRSQAH